MRRLLAAALFFTVLAACQDVHPVSGRRIAPVMGVGGADWLTRPERAEEEHPDEALDLIGIPKGAVVADVGAGVGYYSAKLAKRVGPEGKVYANDIQMSMLERLRQNMAVQHITNVIPVLGAEDDPRLPKEQMDLVLLVDVYHEFSKPVAMIDHIRDSLKPGGRLVLLEYREEDPDVPIRPEHKMSVKTVRKELEPQGLKFEKSNEKLPWQHILIFRKSNDTATKPIGGLAWLVGGVWIADASKMGGGMQRIETRYQWSDNGSFVRFTTHFVTDKAELKRYDGNFFWNPAKATLAMWYMDASNGITEGPVSIEGERTRMTFHGPDFEGKDADLRVDVTRKTADLYTWTLAEKNGEEWKPLAALDYARQGR